MTTQQKAIQEAMESLSKLFAQACEQFDKVANTVNHTVADLQECLGVMKGVQSSIRVLSDLWIDGINRNEENY